MSLTKKLCLVGVLCNILFARSMWHLFGSRIRWATMQIIRPGLHSSFTSVDIARPWSRVDEAIIPQWECTQAGGLCDCVPAERHSEEAVSPSIAHDIRRTGRTGCPNRSVPEHDSMSRRGGPSKTGAPRHVLVHIDPHDYLGSELPLGRYACPRSSCTVAKDPTDDPIMDPAAHVYAACSLSARPKTPRYPHQRSALVSLESPARFPKFNDEAWLRLHNFTDLVRPGLWAVPGACPTPASPGSLPVWPITYSNADWRQYLRPPLTVDKKIQGVAAFISNCDSATTTRRLDLLDALAGSGVPVYWFGKCRNTHSVADVLPHCVARQSAAAGFYNFVKMCVSRNFMFTAAFENDVADDYITEKLFQPLVAGSVPIYAGAPNVSRYLPDADAAIVVDLAAPDGGVAGMVDSVWGMLNNPARYSGALAWKVRYVRYVCPDHLACPCLAMLALPGPGGQGADEVYKSVHPRCHVVDANSSRAGANFASTTECGSGMPLTLCGAHREGRRIWMLELSGGADRNKVLKDLYAHAMTGLTSELLDVRQQKACVRGGKPSSGKCDFKSAENYSLGLRIARTTSRTRGRRCPVSYPCCAARLRRSGIKFGALSATRLRTLINATRWKQVVLAGQPAQGFGHRLNMLGVEGSPGGSALLLARAWRGGRRSEDDTGEAWACWRAAGQHPPGAGGVDDGCLAGGVVAIIIILKGLERLDWGEQKSRPLCARSQCGARRSEKTPPCSAFHSSVSPLRPARACPRTKKRGRGYKSHR